MAQEPANDWVGNANTLSATPEQRLGGITGKGFMPGQSGNPSGHNGRQKGLAALVRSRTEDGKRLVELMWRIARGGRFKVSRTTITGETVEVLLRPSVRDRMDAVAWLADRGWGKAKDVIRLEGDDGGRQAPMLVFLGGDRDYDPLAEPEPKPRRLPPTLPAIAEVPFEMDDIDLPAREGR